MCACAQVGFKPTGRRCTASNCRGRLRDMVLDWDDALPEDDLEASEQHASSAQMALCLGTSLQVRPANSLPLRTVKAGGRQVSGYNCYVLRGLMFIPSADHTTALGLISSTTCLLQPHLAAADRMNPGHFSSFHWHLPTSATESRVC